MSSHNYYVYIMASASGTLYIGVTNNLEKRTWEHQNKIFPGFSATYHCDKLVYCEHYQDVTTAIAREKQLKGWVRRKKERLINSLNPGWHDLSQGW